MRTQFIWRLIAGPTINTSRRTDGCVCILLECRERWTQRRAQCGRRTIRIDVTSFTRWFTLSPFCSAILDSRRTRTYTNPKLISFTRSVWVSRASQYLPETRLGHGIHSNAISAQVLRGQIHPDTVHVRMLAPTLPVGMR